MDSERDDLTRHIDDITTPIEKVKTKIEDTLIEETISVVPLFNDRYLIEKELGRGGIGITYLARDKQLHSMPVVIKVMIEKPGTGAWVKRKFIQESEALTRISHPGVVKVLNRGEFDEGKPFFVMEFVEGRPLRSAMPPEGMDFEYVAHLLHELGHALHAAHEKKIVHRDLKPENILLQTLSGGEEAIKIIDFGIAKFTDSQVGNTTDGNIIAGSLNYMAPEQLLSQAISPATDIYSLGVIAHEMLTGRRPFNPDAKQLLASMQQLLTMQRNGIEVKPRQLRPSLPEATQEILLKALRYEPQNRPQDARKYCEDLAHSLTEQANFFPPDWQRSPETALIGAVKTDGVSPARETGPPPPPPEKSNHLLSLEDKTESNSASANVEVKANVDRDVDLPGTEGLGAIIDPAIVKKRSFKPLILVSILLALAILSALAWQALKPKPAPIVAPPKAEIQLSYFLTVQRDPNRYRGSKPFQLDREILLGDDDLVRFTFIAPHEGHLYIFNESPDNGGTVQFTILFPSPSTNNGSSKLTAEQQILIPKSGEWFKLIKDEGTEKLWIVWASNSIEKLEALKKWANPNDLGEIKDLNQLVDLNALLISQAVHLPTVVKDESQKRTTLIRQGDMLVKLIALEHR
jgi:serine/threonine protein kinase